LRDGNDDDVLQTHDVHAGDGHAERLTNFVHRRTRQLSEGISTQPLPGKGQHACLLGVLLRLTATAREIAGALLDSTSMRTGLALCVS
jgi:hypothetical protein